MRRVHWWTVLSAGFARTGVPDRRLNAGWHRAQSSGRVLLVTGGSVTLLVSAFPLPPIGISPAHFAAALVAFGARGCASGTDITSSTTRPT